ncbi:glycogenin glucosyltransferase [Sporothrix curviconia]|uniref:Glycogenin glucosyltransferase n=1 Tax=Sporothrix curviconia TaxID=1260050 RepID=A0ABP0CEP2_9PEZI
MAHQGGEDIYATLLLSDTYLPGALVLAHSLRDAGTSKKLAVLVTLDTVSAEVVTQLKNVYDYVISVPRIKNEASPDNLHLMNRPDLHSAFTKINLWKQAQFRKIVYIDADVVAYRAPDELFDLPHAFAAAPDIGWPDLFNTGVMVLTPDVGEYYALAAMAQRGISFDGADQGLLNMHFKNSYHRLPFTYNVTPSAHYQYLPAYRHFQSSIAMVHFIGADKPWTQGRGAFHGGGAYDEMVGQWWAVYDRHYRPASPHPSASDLPAAPPPPEIIQYFQKNEPYRPPMEPSWDAQWQPPPSNSKPEAMNFPQTHYEMSRDTAPFVPPPRYASPPRDMWYQVPTTAPAPSHQRPAPIFPWEAHQPAPTRVFVEPPPPPPEPEPTPSQQPSGQSSGYNPHPSFQELGAEPDFTTGSSSMDLKTEPTTPTMPSIVRTLPPSDPWASFTRSNAWDEVPQIERYVDAFQKQHRRVRSRGQVPGGGLRLASGGNGGSVHTGSSGTAGDGAEEDAATIWRRGSKVTDFPTEVERPSLPVTPAPIRRPRHWGSGGPSFGAGGDDDDGDDESLLPAADGVPQQADWDPSSQLQKLAKEQSELLLQKLGHVNDGEGNKGDSGESKTIPLRPLPLGSEGIRSPTYIAQAPVVSPKPIKPGGHETSSVRNIYNQASSGGAEGSSHNDTDEAIIPSFPETKISEPSYLGPGIVFEKDEDYPAHEVTAALPSEEERDVLDT